jgi:hypothetical protein
MQQIIDTLPKMFGEKQGLDFRVWIDHVSFAEVSLGSWLVKFDKWELSGEIIFRGLSFYSSASLFPS